MMRRKNLFAFIAVMTITEASFPQVPIVDPMDPFAGVSSGDDYAARFQIAVSIDPDDPFHNLTQGEWWRFNWSGQWMSAAREGMSFAEFWDSRQGNANEGRSVDIRSPYPFSSAEEHWEAWLEEANGGTSHSRLTLPDWSGSWDGGQFGADGFPEALVRQYWEGVSESYKPRFEMNLQAELEGRAWWPADACVPNGFSRDGWRIKYFMLQPGMVLLNCTHPVTQSRYVFTDGRGFLPPSAAIPQWMGESQGFWDGVELVVWTKNIKPNSGGHGQPEHSDQLELIERYTMLGEQMVVDVTWYDPVAFAFPWHGVGVWNRAGENLWLEEQPTISECATTNNVYHDELGLLGQFTPGDPRWQDIFESTPWITVFNRAEDAKASGLLPAASSFLDLAN